MPDWLSNILECVLDFSNILNASISASWLILVVILLRLVLKKAPRWIHVALWGIVALRLLMPFSIESAFSLIPSAQTVSDQLLQSGPVPGAEPAYLEIVTNPSYGSMVTVELDRNISSFQWDIMFMVIPWMVGMALMALYTAVSYWLLRKKVSTAVILRENIFRSEYAGSPFVLGIIKPKIYLPYTVDEQNMEHVIAHEQAHIRRKDHWWKPLGFLLLTIHWFNPLMWVAYILLCRDIELACDEKVIKELENEQRANYTQALVACAVNRRMIAACPLAFGEVGVKERVKSVMNYKKPAFWVIIVSIAVCAVVALCFLTNPKEEPASHIYEQYYSHTGKQIEVMQGNNENEQGDTTISVKFYSTSGPQLFSVEIWYKANEDAAWTCSEPVNLAVSESFMYSIPANCNYTVMATPLQGQGGYASFEVVVVKTEDKSSSFYFTDENSGKYYLTVPVEGVSSIEVSTLNSSGGCQHADESLFKKGEQVYLDLLDGITDLRGITVTALNADGKVLFKLSVPEGNGEQPINIVAADGWIIAPEAIPSSLEELQSVDIGAEATASERVVMVPTSANISGVFDAYLYLTIDGATYRYERQTTDTESVEAGEYLDTLYEDTGFETYSYEVYSIKGCDDFTKVLAVNSQYGGGVYCYSPSKRCDDSALQDAKDAGYVVMEDGDATSGQESWLDFYETTQQGKAASITVADYHTLNPERCSATYYEAYKEDYPNIFILELSFDGNSYTLKWEEYGTTYTHTYEYLMRYVTNNYSAVSSNLPENTIRYVLTHENTVTWEDLFNGLVSSQMGAYIDHHTIYTDKE